MRALASVMVGCFALSLACGGESVSASEDGASEDDGSTTGEEPESTPCERVLDPTIYPEHLIWSPPPVVADADCPASGPSFVLELPAPILVTGTLAYDGTPGNGNVQLRGRGDEGAVNIPVFGGSFAAEVLPGRYDVVVVPGGSGADLVTVLPLLENVEIVAPIDLPIDVPVVTVTGTMTMDGQPAPDPYGWLWLPGYPGVLLHLIDGNFSLTATPGSYEVLYDFCDPTKSVADDVGSLCFDPDHPPLSDPKLGPDQTRVPFMTLEVGNSDLQIDLDVPTVTLSGTISLDGAPVSASIYFTGEIYNRIDASDGSFAERWVASDNDFVWLELAPVDQWSGDQSELMPELQMIDADMNIDIARESAWITAPWPGHEPFVGLPKLYAWYPGKSFLDINVPWTGAGPLEFAIWPGVRSVAVVGGVCWPDLLGSARSIAVVLGDAIDLSGTVELDTAIEAELAAVHIDLVRESGGSVNELLAIGPLDLPPYSLDPSYSSFPADGAQLDVHGYLPRGPAVVKLNRVPVGVVNIEDGTTLVLRPQSHPIELQLEVGGVMIDPVEHLSSTPAAEPRANGDDIAGGRPPGRYLLLYDGRVDNEKVSDDGLPDNVGATVGCVTREG